MTNTMFLFTPFESCSKVGSNCTISSISEHRDASSWIVSSTSLEVVSYTDGSDTWNTDPVGEFFSAIGGE